MAKLFWENTKQLAGVKLPHMHPETWAMDLLLAKVCPRREAAAIICGIWALWVARDRKHHGEQPIQVQEAMLQHFLMSLAISAVLCKVIRLAP